MKRYEPAIHAADAGEMLEHSEGRYVRYPQAAALGRERDDWKSAHDNSLAVYRDIGLALGANMPAELVNEVARRRMAERAALIIENDALREELRTLKWAPKYPYDNN